MVGMPTRPRYPDKQALIVIDSPIPGIRRGNQIVRLPALWHFNFGAPGCRALVAWRERIYLDRFWRRVRRDPSRLTKRPAATTPRSTPGRAMHSAFAQFFAIDQKDEATPQGDGRQSWALPVLAVGAEKASAPKVRSYAQLRRRTCRSRRADAGHWLMEEAPAATIAAVQDFLENRKSRQLCRTKK